MEIMSNNLNNLFTFQPFKIRFSLYANIITILCSTFLTRGILLRFYVCDPMSSSLCSGLKKENLIQYICGQRACECRWIGSDEIVEEEEEHYRIYFIDIIIINNILSSSSPLARMARRRSHLHKN
jgi:hypothetical protein